VAGRVESYDVITFQSGKYLHLPARSFEQRPGIVNFEGNRLRQCAALPL
jgi:hypothetical protein